MIYTIYGKPDRSFLTEDPDQFDALEAVPEGLAKWALVAPPVWLIINRLWWPLLICLMFWALCLAILTTPFFALTPLIFGLPGLYLMLEGREIYRRKLETQGLAMIGLVDATNEQAAIARFLDVQQNATVQHSPLGTSTLPVSPPRLAAASSEPASVFGLFSSRGS